MEREVRHKRIGGFVGGLRHRRSIRRLSRAAIVSLGVLTIAFALLRLVPGDPVLVLLGVDYATEERVAVLREQLGLNGTLPEQYMAYVLGVFRGDLGRSILSGEPVTAIIGRTLPVTMWLVGTSLLVAVVVAAPLAIVAASRRHTRFAEFFRVITSISLSIPIFFTGLLLILVFAVWLGVAPVGGYEPDFPANLRYLWLPALASAGILVPIISRVMEKSISHTIDEEFIESAILRDVPRGRFLVHYLLRPSLAPTVALLGYIIGAALGGAAITEIVFNLPGLSSVLVNAVLIRDYPVVQGTTLILGVIVVGVTFLSDVIAERLDPRATAL